MITCDVCRQSATGECPCRTARYCDEKCQSADWPRHSLQCPASSAHVGLTVETKIDKPIFLALANLDGNNILTAEQRKTMVQATGEGKYTDVELFTEAIKSTQLWKDFASDNKKNRKTDFTVFAPHNEAMLTWILRSGLVQEGEVKILEFGGQAIFKELNDVVRKIAKPAEIVIKDDAGKIDDKETKRQRELAQRMLAILLSHIVPGFRPPTDVSIVIPPRGRSFIPGIKEIELPRITFNGLKETFGKSSGLPTLQTNERENQVYKDVSILDPRAQEIIKAWSNDIGDEVLRTVVVRTLTDNEFIKLKDEAKTDNRVRRELEIFFKPPEGESQATQISGIFAGDMTILGQNGFAYIIDNVLETL